MIFFTLGTAVFILYAITLSSFVAFGGYAVLVAGVVINWFYVIVLLFNLLVNKISSARLLKTIGIMALNLPVAVVYTYYGAVLMGYARITFRNNTPSDIVALRIEGCQKKEIRDLKRGESETVWIKIPGDCQVDIEYDVSGTTKIETAVGYLTNQGGLKATYEIGSNRDALKDL